MKSTILRSRLTPIAFALFVCLLAAQPVWAQPDEVHRKILPATGFVVVQKDEKNVGYGTCWIFDRARRIVVTNVHVVGTSSKARVAFPRVNKGQLITSSANYGTKDYINGKVIARDPKRDLALIQLEKLPASAVELELASESIAPGGQVWAIGNSGMAQKQLDQGTLWRTRKGTVKAGLFTITPLKDTKLVLETRVIHTDSGTKPGDSGGPVVDDKGQLVGVTSFSTDQADGAIDVSEVRVFLARSMPLKKPLPPKGPAGTWTVKWKVKEVENYAGLALRTSGTGHWDGSKLCPGTYTYADETLTLKMPGSGLDVPLQLTWDGDNVFHFTMNQSEGPVEFTATRR